MEEGAYNLLFCMDIVEDLVLLLSFAPNCNELLCVTPGYSAVSSARCAPRVHVVCVSCEESQHYLSPLASKHSCVIYAQP